MKRNILLVLLLLTVFAFGSANAQCTPDPIASAIGIPGFYPSPQTGPLPDGTVGQAFTQTITVVVPQDTSIDLTPFGIPTTMTVTVNHVTVNSMSDLAPGLSFGACDTASCTWLTGQSGCFTISGTPTTAGAYEPTLNLTFNIEVPGLGPRDLPPADFVTWDHTVKTATSIDPDNFAGFALGQNVPNPANGMTLVPFSVENAGNYTFEVLDLTGKVMHSEAVRVAAGDNAIQFDGSKFAPGLYLYRLSDGSAALTKRMMIAK